MQRARRALPANAPAASFVCAEVDAVSVFVPCNERANPRTPAVRRTPQGKLRGSNPDAVEYEHTLTVQTPSGNADVVPVNVLHRREPGGRRRAAQWSTRDRNASRLRRSQGVERRFEYRHPDAIGGTVGPGCLAADHLRVERHTALGELHGPGALMFRVREALDDGLPLELIDEPLNALSRLTHRTGDLRDGKRALSHGHGAEPLSTRGREPGTFAERVAGGEAGAVQAEYLEHDRRESITGPRVLERGAGPAHFGS